MVLRELLSILGHRIGVANVGFAVRSHLSYPRGSLYRIDQR